MAFSKNVSSSTDNIGYIIPYAIVEHFLSEYLAAGSYQGICSPGFYTQPMENPAQQQYLQVGPWCVTHSVTAWCAPCHGSCLWCVDRCLSSGRQLLTEEPSHPGQRVGLALLHTCCVTAVSTLCHRFINAASVLRHRRSLRLPQAALLSSWSPPQRRQHTCSWLT